MEINLYEQFLLLFDSDKRFYPIYILSSLLIAVIYLLYKKREKRVILSKKLWLHPSSILDYKYFILSFFIKIALILPLVIGANEVAIYVYEKLTYYYGFKKVSTSAYSYETIVIFYTFTLFVLSDFTRYWLHRFLHTIPILWEFHKVHHSAKVLNPFTFYRIHPVENILFAFRYSFSIGTVTGVFLYFFGAYISIAEILGANIFLFFFSLLGSNLRHSHIKIVYPKIVENIFISPYQHQIHHSKKHFNKNYGGYIAIWDKLFGSLEYSANVHAVKFGLRQKDQYKTLFDLLFTPFKGSFMKVKSYSLFFPLVIGIVVLFAGCSNSKLVQEDIRIKKTQEENLGKKLFSDPILSLNQTQSCATCHNPQFAFIDNRKLVLNGAVSLGDDGYSIGTRNTPSAAYAMFSPEFHFDKKAKLYKGGQFWDGREKNLEGQAGGPPLNPVEMNMPNIKTIIARIEQREDYNKDFKEIYGDNVFEDEKVAYEKLKNAIASFERTQEFSPFDSKYDRYLKGEYELTPLEDLGRSLFFSNNNTSCASCHLLKTEDSKNETFTSYAYHNIGVPKNEKLIKFLANENYIDRGLMQFTKNPADDGKFKTPSLRNVAVTAPYMHNGVFENLFTAVMFYDKYTSKQPTSNPETKKPWGEPEIAVNKADLELLQGGKSIAGRKAEALVAFLKLLTDKRYEYLLEESKDTLNIPNLKEQN